MLEANRQYISCLIEREFWYLIPESDTYMNVIVKDVGVGRLLYVGQRAYVYFSKKEGNIRPLELMWYSAREDRFVPAPGTWDVKIYGLTSEDSPIYNEDYDNDTNDE